MQMHSNLYTPLARNETYKERSYLLKHILSLNFYVRLHKWFFVPQTLYLFCTFLLGDSFIHFFTWTKFRLLWLSLGVKKTPGNIHTHSYTLLPVKVTQIFLKILL